MRWGRLAGRVAGDRGSRGWTIAVTGVMVVVTAYFLVPVVWLFIASTKSNADLFATVSNLQLKLGLKVLPDGCLEKATRVSTALAEIVAVRAACKSLNSFQLDGCSVYTSCEPCSGCVATMLMAGVARMYYGASLNQSGAVVPRARDSSVPI